MPVSDAEYQATRAEVTRLRVEFDQLRRRFVDVWPPRHRPTDAGGSAGGMEVNVSQTGGSAGNSTTTCSFTYNVTDAITAASLGTGVAINGNGQRVVNATMTAGTKGRGYINSSGVFVLRWVDERITQTNCSSTQGNLVAAPGEDPNAFQLVRSIKSISLSGQLTSPVAK